MKTKKISARQQAPKATRKDSPTAARVRKVTREKPKTAYDLLARVAEHILEEPKRFYQRRWFLRGQKAINDFGLAAPKCGTVCCRAGWIVLLNDGLRTPIDDTQLVGARAADILGMPAPEKSGGTFGCDPNATAELFDADAVHGRAGTLAYAKRGVRGLREFMKQHAVHLKARLLSDVPKLSKG